MEAGRSGKERIGSERSAAQRTASSQGCVDRVIDPLELFRVVVAFHVLSLSFSLTRRRRRRCLHLHLAIAIFAHDPLPLDVLQLGDCRRVRSDRRLMPERRRRARTGGVK